MVDAQRRVESRLKEFLGADVAITNSTLIVMEAHDPACKIQYGQAGLSEGNCAIVGYIASSEADVTTRAIDKAPTAVGLAGRLGARDSRLQSFELRDIAPARQTARLTRSRMPGPKLRSWRPRQIAISAECSAFNMALTGASLFAASAMLRFFRRYRHPHLRRLQFKWT